MLPAKERRLDTDGRVFCPHGKQSVAKSTDWLHKRTYFNSTMKEWQKSRIRNGVQVTQTTILLLLTCEMKTNLYWKLTMAVLKAILAVIMVYQHIRNQ